MSLLYSGYALEEWCAARKFGSHYVKLRTPLSNIRITTFVCNETEVKIIDPIKLEVIEAVGCKSGRCAFDTSDFGHRLLPSDLPYV